MDLYFSLRVHQNHIYKYTQNDAWLNEKLIFEVLPLKCKLQETTVTFSIVPHGLRMTILGAPRNYIRSLTSLYFNIPKSESSWLPKVLSKLSLSYNFTLVIILFFSLAVFSEFGILKSVLVLFECVLRV